MLLSSLVRFASNLEMTRQVPRHASIIVGGLVVNSLVPLGGFHRPGITKVGRLSFSGYCQGRKVKVYSVSSTEQALLRSSLQTADLCGFTFPEIVAIDDCVIVESWVEGVACDKLRGKSKAIAKDILSNFFVMAHCENLLQPIVSRHASSFCYFEDYLQERLKIWLPLKPIGDFYSRWRLLWGGFRNIVPSRLCHPDLSARNLIFDHRNCRLVSVDNELLGVGPGWILDIRNSWLGADRIDHGFSRYPELSDAAWRLRTLGSLLDAGKVGSAVRLASE